jgi:L-ascorbate metabolism protein UlaG (beta-lactamase superfamily)
VSARLTYVGHATVAIELDGVRLLTDPVLRARVAHLARRVPSATPEMVADLDAVLISHAHRDHLDLPSLQRLRPSCPVIVPRGHAGLVTSVFGEVIEVDEGDRVRVGALEIEATRADHDGRRVPVGRAVPAVGYLVHGSRSVYFAGDTDLFAGMRDLHEALDVALLPVAGWGPRVPAGHLDPERAAQAAALLRPRIAIPIHWGTYGAPGSKGGDPAAAPREFTEHVTAAAPGVEVRVLEPGASTSF